MSDHITLEASVVAAIGLDVNVLMAYLEGVTDQRHGRGKRYSL